MLTLTGPPLHTNDSQLSPSDTRGYVNPYRPPLHSNTSQVSCTDSTKALLS